MIKKYHVLLILVIITIVNNTSFAGGKLPKHEKIKDVLNVIDQIFLLAESAKPITGNEMPNLPKVDKILDPIKNVEDLSKIALICDTIAYPQSASDVVFDYYFSYAYWSCIKRLSNTESEDAFYALMYIAKRSSLDGGDKMVLEDLISNLKKRLGTRGQNRDDHK